MSAAHFVTRDPETGILGMGNYRAQVKTPTRLGCFSGSTQDIAVNWHKWKALGKPMEAAIVIGVTPNLSYVATTKLPHDIPEYDVAGGIAGAPVELVRCRTVDLLVPAHSEIVIEGVIPTDRLEMEGPFGEFTGYMAQRDWSLFLDVGCITRRRTPIFQAFLSQFPPSESSKLRGVGKEEVLFKRLTVDHAIPGILEVALHEPAGSYGICVLKIDKSKGGDVRKALEIIGRDARLHSKMVVAVDADVDARDADSVNWAISFGMQAYRDAWVVPVRPLDLDYSVAPPDERRDLTAEAKQGSALLIDATRKWPYPPTSLPARPYMERALEIWQSEGLPPLNLKVPWYGCELGHWTDEDREEARLATEGEYLKTGAKQGQNQRPV
jgi:4-hydroxy-3-polyprenylbenzoate decarboxylase